MLSTTSRDASASGHKVEPMSEKNSNDTQIIDLNVSVVPNFDNQATTRLADLLLKQWSDKTAGYDPKEVLIVLGNLEPDEFLDPDKTEEVLYETFFKGPLEILDCATGVITEEPNAISTSPSKVSAVLEKILDETHCPHALAITVLRRPANDPMWTTIQGMLNPGTPASKQP